MYIMIQEKSQANETELLFIIDIKLAAFISSIGPKTEIRLFPQDQYNTQSTFFKEFSSVQTINWFRKECATSHPHLRT